MFIKKRILLCSLAASLSCSSLFSTGQVIHVSSDKPSSWFKMPSFSVPATPEPVKKVLTYEKLFGTLGSFAELMQLWTEWRVSKKLRPLRERQNDLMEEIVDHQQHAKEAVEGSVARRGMLLAIEDLQAEHDEVKPVADEVEAKGRVSIGRWMRAAQILYALDAGFHPYDKTQKYNTYSRGSSALGHLLTMRAKEHAGIGEYLMLRVYLTMARLGIHLSRNVMRKFGNEKTFKSRLDNIDLLRSGFATSGSTAKKTRAAALLAHLASSGISWKESSNFNAALPKQKGAGSWRERFRTGFVGRQIDGDVCCGNLCTLFGVEKNGLTYAKLRKAYLKLALADHPDKTSAMSAEEKINGEKRFKIAGLIWNIFDEGSDCEDKESKFANRLRALEYNINQTDYDDLQKAADSLRPVGSAPTPDPTGEPTEQTFGQFVTSTLFG